LTKVIETTVSPLYSICLDVFFLLTLHVHCDSIWFGGYSIYFFFFIYLSSTSICVSPLKNHSSPTISFPFRFSHCFFIANFIEKKILKLKNISISSFFNFSILRFGSYFFIIFLFEIIYKIDFFFATSSSFVLFLIFFFDKFLYWFFILKH